MTGGIPRVTGRSPAAVASKTDAAERAASEEMPKSPDELMQAFALFNTATERLVAQYGALQEEVGRLRDELAAKNAELRQSLRARAEVEDTLHHVLMSITAGIVVVDLAGRVLLTNRACEFLLEVESREIQGRLVADLFPGSPVAELLEWALTSTAHTQREREMELAPRAGRGDPRHLTVVVAQVRDQSDAPVGALAVINDLTRIKRLEALGRRTDRLTAMGEMAAQLAHEIGNPLGSIELFASLLRRTVAGHTDAAGLCDNLLRGVRSLASIVNNIRTFTRDLQPTRESVDLPAVIADGISLATHVLEAKRIRLRTDFAPEMPGAFLDPELFKQMLLNLILNAVDAMDSEGTLQLSARGYAALDDESGRWRRYHEVRVADSGRGIDPEDLPRIFDPFFSRRRGGSGLGLSVVNEIVTRHRGTIEVDSRPGEGTAFLIILPGAELSEERP